MALMAAGSALMGIGVIQHWPPKAPSPVVQQPQVLTSQEVTPAEVAPAEQVTVESYMGYNWTPLQGTTLDGHPVKANFFMLWRDDAPNTSPQAYDLLSGHHNYVFEHKVTPLIQQRFAQLVSQIPAEAMEVTELGHLIAFDKMSPQLESEVKGLGITATRMFVGHVDIQYGTETPPSSAINWGNLPDE